MTQNADSVGRYDEMDEHDLAVHRDEGPCHGCNLPYKAKAKWNGGNVVTIWIPSCDCADEAVEALLERLTPPSCLHQGQPADTTYSQYYETVR